MSIAPGPDTDIQVLIERKKKELTERFGAKFGDCRRLPPEVEYAWLCSVEEFEERTKNSSLITVREFLGNPRPTPLSDIPPARVQQEVDTFLEFLHSRDIEVCFGEGITPPEAYCYLTDELLNELIENVRQPGFHTVFVFGVADDDNGGNPPAVN